MKRINEQRRNRGFAIRDLAVLMTCGLVAAGLAVSLGGANRTLSQASQCTANLETLFGGLMAYVNVYNSYPPHNPYPRWLPMGASQIVTKGSYTDVSGIDPNIGWIMTYGLAMTPPATYMDDPDPTKRCAHFKWWVLNPDQLPSVCVCPAANYTTLFTPNPEVDMNNPESFVYQYAAFYQTSGTIRCGTPVIGKSGYGTDGGRNPPIPNPTSTSAAARQPASNAQGGVPYVWLYEKDWRSDGRIPAW